MAPEQIQIEKPKTIQDLFTPLEQAQQRRGIKALFWGPWGTGKTYAALSFPEPIYVLSTEDGVAPLAHHFKGKDIKIVECAKPYTEKPILKSTGQELDEPAVMDPVESLAAFEEGCNMLQNVEKGTIVVDSVSDIWEWLGTWLKYNAAKSVSKSSGKEFMMQTEWALANSKYKVLLFKLMTRPCNVVFTARSANLYDAAGQQTMQQKASTQKNTQYWIDISAEFKKIPMPEAPGSTKLIQKRVATIDKCRFGDVPNPVIPDLTYQKLKESLKGHVPEGIFQ